MTKHAFLMTCHENLRGALYCTLNLKKRWGKNSHIFCYMDGRIPDEDPMVVQIKENVTGFIRSPYEPEKAQSLLNGFNAMMDLASKQKIDVASFIQADMIPLYPETFLDFIVRFHKSGKLVTYSPMTPRGHLIEAGNLHFNVESCVQAGLVPTLKDEGVKGTAYDFFEYHLTSSFDKRVRQWRQDRAYLMWYLTFASGQTQGTFLDGAFLFKNYVPESSMISCDSEWFWENYERLSNL